tara:strand:+ start:599 stop:2371 length:1773 start_codon:yes stop_codon:yes gene_type:complete
MKILKLLNKNYLSIIFILLVALESFAEDEPADIWNINEKKSKDQKEINILTDENENSSLSSTGNSIYKMQSQYQSDTITFDENLGSQEIKLVGLYDPEDFGLDIDMWKNSDGDQLKNIFLKLNKMNLSKDANQILEIALFTNSFYPKKNIKEEEFLKFKSDWLIKNSNYSLIEEYLIKNQIVNAHSKLSKYLVDYYLSNGELNNACNFFEKNKEPITDEYLSKFEIYCLIKKGKKDEAQIIFDLKKEIGFKDKYFEKKINNLLGFDTKKENTISEKTILDFHLAHQVNPKFSFEPKTSTDKIIWKYLASFNLLNAFQEIDISELDKISTIEMAVHNKNYPEKDLFELYKRFQFNINQLLNAQSSYKSLSKIEARALIYQKILLESEMVEKLKLLKILKNSFEEENIGLAFDVELKKFLKEIDPLTIPDNLTSFYYTNIQIDKKNNKKIKYNNDVLHQSKLINYFNKNYSKSKIEKDIENFLRKIKKNKKYFLSKNDIIFIESLKSDGIAIDKKYDDLYEINASEIPTDIQVMINNNEKGAALLRIAEVIGEDEIERMDEDTMYFIITTLNQLNIDRIRNKILLQVLPLKV